MENEKWKQKVSEAILKIAKGCSVAEVVEEYAEVDGQMKLTKRKKTKKEIPPDIKALQLLLEGTGAENLRALSDEELEEEKTRLLSTLAEKQQKETKVKRRPMKKAVKRRKGEEV